MLDITIRPSGLQPLDDIPWGTHLCSFYDTKEDLVDLLVPYFVAGLESNEKCVWVTSTPLTPEDAARAMRGTVDGFDEMLAEGRMVIRPHDQWYVLDGAFDMERVLAAWASEVDSAVAQGYDGLRVTGNTAWLEATQWDAFVEYERTIDSAVEHSPILVLCTYSLQRCAATEIIEVVDCHESSLIKQGGRWTVIESAEVTRARSALAAESRFVSALLDATTALVATVDAEGRIIRCNSACESLIGRPRTQIEGAFAWDVVQLPQSRVLELLAACWEAGGANSFESPISIGDGRVRTIAWSTAGVRDSDGELAFLVATGQDITPHREAERKLQAAYELEHHVAKTLQESLLRPRPEIPGLRLGVAYKPAIEAERVGGDFYDIFQLDPSRVVVIVGDVSGKGVSAAGLTETVRSSLRALLYMDLPPEEAMTKAGRVLLDQTRPEQFATVGVAVLDLDTNELLYTSAGHPPPILCGGETRFMAVTQGAPLGAYAHRYECASVRLEPSQCLVMYTDGLGDARDQQVFFWDHILQVADRQETDPESIVCGLLGAAENFSSKPLADDIAIVALRVE